jgi:hypothetical protein
MPLVQDLIAAQAYVPTRLFPKEGAATGGTAQLTNAAATIYTQPSGAGRCLVTGVVVTNVNTTTVETVTLRLVGVGGSSGSTFNVGLSGTSIQPSDSKIIEFNPPLVMAAGDFLSALAGANSAINMHVFGLVERTQQVQ